MPAFTCDSGHVRTRPPPPHISRYIPDRLRGVSLGREIWGQGDIAGRSRVVSWHRESHPRGQEFGALKIGVFCHYIDVADHPLTGELVIK